MDEEKNESLLIEKAKKGDIKAFETLIIQCEKMVYNIAYRMMNHKEDAKDISQEVFLKVYKNIEKFDEKSSFSTWIYRIAMNTCIDALRKQKGKQTFSIEEELEQENSTIKKQFAAQENTPEENTIEKEQKEELLYAISSLNEKHKAVITLRDLEGFSYSEIAEITQTTVGTVKSRLARAREQLKNILELIEQRNRQNKEKGGRQ